MFRVFGTITFAAALGLSTSAMGQTSGTLSSKFARAAAQHAAGTRKSAMPVRALLRKHVDKVDWVEVTFEEVLDWMRGMADDNVNIVPRWTALSAVGVDTDSPVTLKLKDITVAEVLNEVMGALSEDNQVIYRGERNVLRISSKDDFNSKLEVKVYDLTDILFFIPDMGRSAPLVDLQAASRAGGSSGGGGGGGRGVFRGGSSGQSEELEQELSDLEERLETLRDLIYQVIEPDTWIENGGTGTIQIYNGRSLIVRTTIEVHEHLGGPFEYDR